MSFTIIKLAENLKRMEVKELRLNNLIFDDNGDITNVFVLSDYGSCEINDDQVSYRYEPIPLTEKWPAKFGYEDFVDMSCDLAKKSKYPIEIVSDDLLKLKVHELQNLWTSLTGEELEIKDLI